VQDHDELHLVDASLKGNGSAFAKLVRPHLAMLFRISARVCRNEALAEDAVQETLTAAYMNLKRYRPGTSLKAFLAAIAVKRAHTLGRSEIRRKAREKRAAPAVSASSAEELVDAAQQAVLIRNILLAMPEKRRDAALLRLEGGLSYREIAAALQTSEASARVMVHTALKILRKRLANLLEGNDSRGRQGG